MNRRHVEGCLWVLSFAVLLWGWARWERADVAPASGPVYSVGGVPGPPARPPSSQLAASARRIAERNPFRLDRAPAPIGFSAPPGMSPMASMPPAPTSYRPPLAIGGIVGPPWEALLEGVPGEERGVVVRTGSTLGELKVRSVSRDLVVIQGQDTTWRLSVKKAW